MPEGYRETTIDHLTGDALCSVSTGEQTVRNRLLRLQEQHPDQVRCVALNDDGSVYFKVPWSWVRITPPRQVNMTEEQKQAAAERLRAAREQKTVEKRADSV